MARPRKEVKSVRVRLDGYLEPGRDDDILDWLNSLPIGTKFPAVINRLRMGGVVEKAVATGNTEEAMDALQDLIGAFVT